MKIADNKIEKIFEISEQVVCSGINAIYEYQRVNSYMPSYYSYPEEWFKGIETTDIYKKMVESVPDYRKDHGVTHTLLRVNIELTAVAITLIGVGLWLAVFYATYESPF